jgi:hypothetical protein
MSPQVVEAIFIDRDSVFSGSETVNIKIDAYKLLDIENVDETGPRVPKVLGKITRSSRLALEWGKMYAEYVITLSKFKSEEQLCLAAMVNIVHIQRIQDELNVLAKYIEENNL